MTATVNVEDSYKVKTVTEATYEEEEGEFASADSPNIRAGSANKNYMYIAPIPSFCKVNPNLPNSDSNQQETIVRGIERASEIADVHMEESKKSCFKRYRLSDFEKIEKIGEGTFGKVYRAEYRDPETGKT